MHTHMVYVSSLHREYEGVSGGSLSTRSVRVDETHRPLLVLLIELPSLSDNPFVADPRGSTTHSLRSCPSDGMCMYPCLSG